MINIRKRADDTVEIVLYVEYQQYKAVIRNVGGTFNIRIRMPERDRFTFDTPHFNPFVLEMVGLRFSPIGDDEFITWLRNAYDFYELVGFRDYDVEYDADSAFNDSYDESNDDIFQQQLDAYNADQDDVHDMFVVATPSSLCTA